MSSLLRPLGILLMWWGLSTTKIPPIYLSQQIIEGACSCCHTPPQSL
nr:MAG TPA: cytochrome C6 [Caudoviricetes sp.]